MAWAFDLEGLDGTPVGSDMPAAGGRAVWSIDGPGSVEIELREQDAAQWLAGQRRVVLRQDSTDEWRGRLWSLSEDFQKFDDEFRAVLRATGLGLASELDNGETRRIVHGDFSRSNVVATTIAWDLIAHAQAQADGDHGFTLGTITGTAPARTRDYCDGDGIVDAINELAAMDTGGFDWEIDEAGAFNAWVGGRGSASGETLARGDVREWHVRNDTTPLATYATALGSTEQPCGAPLEVQSSALAATYGRREVAVDVDTRDEGELIEVGFEVLRARAASRLRVRAIYDEDRAPWAWRSVWLGDTLSVVLPAHFGGTQTMRVIEVAVTVEPPDFAFVEYEMELV